MTKVLQARYFKQTNFLHAKLRSNPSYIWRSILWGKYVIHKGYRWRIGRGNSVHIYNNNWIPRGETFRPISIPSLPTDSYVNEQIGFDNKWDVAKIYQNFIKDDAELIVSIPRLKEPADDQLFWHYDKQGNYYVKSRFQIAQKIKFPSPPSGSKTNSEIWKVLWNFTLPAKVKNFMWRAIKNLVPTSENLWHK